METLKFRARLFLTVTLVFLMSLTWALPDETEYSGEIAAEGYFDDNFWGDFPIGFDFDFFGNTYTDFLCDLQWIGHVWVGLYPLHKQNYSHRRNSKQLYCSLLG